MADELVNVVNENDEIIGQELRSLCHERGLCHRISCILLFDNKGKLWLQTRAKEKSGAGKFDFSASGHVALGDNYEESAYRELQEELGISTMLQAVAESLSEPRIEEKKTPKHMMSLFIGFHNGPFIIKEEEIEKIESYEISEIINMIKIYPDRFTEGFQIGFNKYLELLNRKLGKDEIPKDIRKPLDVYKIREDFPFFKHNPNLIYFDNAATSQRPKQVIEAEKNFSEKENANIHRGVYTLAENAIIKFNESRRKIASFINAEEKEIVFTKNATESLNLLSYTIKDIISQGKNEILLTEMEHHSNIVPWQNLAKKHNFIIKYVKINEKFGLDMEDLKRKITDKTAILSLTHVSNVLGTENPIKEIIKLAKTLNPEIITIIDVAQSIAHKKIDVKNLECDFLVFSSHKMLGPTGVGVLYGKRDLLQKLPPFNFGGGMIEQVTFTNSRFLEHPEKFEAGTQNISEIISLCEAIKYLESLTLEKIQEYEKELVSYAFAKIKEIKNIQIFSHADSLNIISFTINGLHAHDVASYLNEKGIAIRAGHLCAMPLVNEVLKQDSLCRVSLAFYNTKEEVDKFITALKEIASEPLNPNFIGEVDPEMIKENILDHYKNPRNFKPAINRNFYYKTYNPVCGDEIEISIELEGNKIKDISFLGKGCVISIAAASMLTELVKGKSLEEIRKINEEEMKKLLGIRLGIVRTRCATLPLVALNKLLNQPQIK